jgi:hypothetical protein
VHGFRRTLSPDVLDIVIRNHVLFTCWYNFSGLDMMVTSDVFRPNPPLGTDLYGLVGQDPYRNIPALETGRGINMYRQIAYLPIY